jgi:hypothetical protein
MWPGGGCPHFASVVVGRVAHVTDETSEDAAYGVDGTDVDAVADALRETRAKLLEVPAEVVVTNHAVGLYELAAIHLSAEQPDLVSAALAIDGLACLVDGLGDRLGEETSTLRDALATIRMAFVQIKSTTGQSAPGDD